MTDAKVITNEQLDQLRKVAKDGGVCGSQGRGSGSAAAPALSHWRGRDARLQREQHKRDDAQRYRDDYRNINS